MSPFYLLLRNDNLEKPYFMSKVCAQSKLAAIKNFLYSMTHFKMQDWFSEEELLNFVREPHELNEKDKLWLQEGGCL